MLAVEVRASLQKFILSFHYVGRQSALCQMSHPAGTQHFDSCSFPVNNTITCSTRAWET